jgi:hypothetical protein
MAPTKRRRQVRPQDAADALRKRESPDATRNDTVLLMATGEPNPKTLAAIVSGWVAPRLAEEFLREHRLRISKDDSDMQASPKKP